MTGRPNSSLYTAVAILMFSVSVPAQTPLTLTGWNADVIYENDDSPLITASVDYNGDTFAENGLVLPAYESSSGAYIGTQSVVGLPNGGVLTSLAANVITGSHTSFALQDYNANNAALLRPAVGYLGIPGYAGDLSLTTSQRLSSLALLHTSTIDGGQLQINATLTFEDNSKGSFSFLSNNWRQEIGAPLPADTAISRVERVKDGPPEGTGPDYYFPGQQKWVMYEADINLTALGYDTKAIKSIALDRGNFSESYWLTSAVFAVSGSKLGNRNEFLHGTDLISSVNYQLTANPSIHRIPTANSDDVLLQTASGTNLSLNGANLIMGSLNVTNATIYTLRNEGVATTSVLTLGTSSNSISSASPNDLIHLGPFSNGLTIRGTSSDGGALTLALTRTGNFNVARLDATLEISAGISGNGFGFNKTGGGKVVLLGDNSFSGTTTISAGKLDAAANGALGNTSNIVIDAGGTLLLSGTGLDRLNDSASVSIASGGVLLFGDTAGAASETFGALTLSADGTLGFGSSDGAFAATFASLILPNTGFATILNWDGLLGESRDRLLFRSIPELTSTDAIRFDIDGTLHSTQFVQVSEGLYEALPNQILVAVPEPTGVFGSLALLSFCLCSRRNPGALRPRCMP